MRSSFVILAGLATALCTAQFTWAQAQQPPAPMSIYSGSFGGGFALTGGNTDTTNYNLTFNLVRDPKMKSVFKADALYLRGSQNGELNLHRSAAKARYEYNLTSRVFLFAEFGAMRDEFKQIDYLLAPIAGVGYKLINTDRTLLSVSAGAGGYFEKNPDLPIKKSGSVNAGQEFSHKLTATTTITQSIYTLWKANDFEDSLTNFRAGVTTTLYQNLELKVEFLDSYKTKPPNPTIKKNDTAFLTTFLFKY
jgi:putative salt-induced outer membrane protein YdiY